MTETLDTLGIVRQHRWLSADKQAEILQPRCRKVLSLGGGSAQKITREDLEQLARKGRVFELVHAFLLADPARKKVKGGLQADFRVILAKLEKRGAVVRDVDGSICSTKHRRALLALADRDIARSNQGAKSAANGARSRGRVPADFTKAQWDEAYNIWHNAKAFPTWKDVRCALKKIVSPNGQKFTVDRAFAKWRGRH